MAEKADRTRRKVVIVEDEPGMIQFIELVLSDLGFEVIGALGGREGLEAIAREKPDLVLLDLMMPVVDGWGVYTEMKADEHLKTIPVIVITAKTDSLTEQLSLDVARVQDFIKKPFDRAELLDSIAKVLGDDSIRA